MNQEVKTISGIGEKTAEILNKAGIFTVRDLLYYLPRDYENFQSAVKIKDLRPGKAMIRGKIRNLRTNYTRRRGLSITEGEIVDDTGAIRTVWFNQPYRAKQFDEKREYYFTGQYDFKAGRYQLTSPSAILAEDAATARSDLNPIYPAKSSIKPLQFLKFFEKLKPNFAKIPDLIPEDAAPAYAEKNARKTALYKAHFPDIKTEVEEARKYLAYEELFELLLAAQLSKQENQKLQAEPLKFNLESTKKIIGALPFALTPAQKRATWDILQDLEKTTPENRLLQGDVGSGKTVVAAISAFQAIQNGFQVALLAPTSVLAKQHAESLDALLGPLGVKTALLTGDSKHKQLVRDQIKRGNVDLVIGTHALITDDTIFYNLAFCIIDEQHRFGVNQRQKLLTKVEKNVVNQEKPGESPKAPHLLAMTATPIPRSLQLTVFGDLDVSVINQMPEGRKPINTKVIREIDQKQLLYPKIREEIEKNHQIYWICRAIEDNPQTETASVKKQAKKLQEIFKGRTIEFLHGRMKPAEKDEIMQKFASGKIDILVSTTVVEVGVNVPNATVMVIQDAENYGLAQLHQLRGRVGRGQDESFCYLISSAENPTRRLKAMEDTADGFKLAELDLKIRGPGEIYGSLQHGALDLRIASLSDTALIADAQKQAKAVAAKIAADPEYMLKYKELSQGISHYQQLTTLN